MVIRKLRPGKSAPEAANRIHIDRLADGRISWTGSVESAGRAVFGTSPTGFSTIQEAETDAIAWARRYGATDLQIEGPNP